MPKFTKSDNVNIDVDIDMDIDVHDFYEQMDDDEKEEMAHLISEDVQILDFIGGDNRQNMYKELAYYVGNSDSENLEFLINELQYWSNK